MDSSTLILIAALVLAVAVGPSIGYVIARRRLERKLQGKLDRSSRFADLDAQVRSIPMSLDPVEPHDLPVPEASRAGGRLPQAAAPRGPSPSSQRIPDVLGPFEHGFDQAPPAFAPEPTGSPEPIPGSRPTEGGAHDTGRGTVRPPTPQAAESPSAPSFPADSPRFRPIAEYVDDEVRHRMSWLAQVSAGRMLALHRLGYDDPVKVANLRAVEVSRLARALHVAESEIEEVWMPAARRELGMRRFDA